MRIIYTDDEMPAIANFELTVASFPEIEELNTFLRGEDALEFAKNNIVDAAFLDMEMPGIHGLELARELKKINPNTRIIFVTAYSEYALDAWGVDATGYLLKPYTQSDIKKELGKCTYKPLPSHRVSIETIPTLSVTVDGVPLHISAAKPRELFALLVDRGEAGFTKGECIACLWPERQDDASTQSLYRMTWKRLADALEEAGVGELIKKADNRRYLECSLVDCDLYRILSGDRQTAKKYNGAYLQEYPWAEERNSQLYRMIL